ncbi:atherin [Ditylenchus destructor]|nr:atherin [Ditylenchus destructor]
MFQSRPVKLQATNILPTEVINDVVQFMAIEDLKRLKMTSRVLHVHISRRLQKIKPSTENSKAAQPPIKSNPAKWTCEDVSQWFTDAEYPELAKKLLEQKYNGKAIMLFKRDDLISLIYRNEEINFFGLKQGPALIVHALIEELKKASQQMSE